MIATLIQSGYRLSASRDPRLARGLVWSLLEGVFAAAPYPLLFLLLRDAFGGSASPGRIALIAVAMAACLLLRIACGLRALPLLFTGAYALMGQARLRIADRLRQLPMGWFARQRSGDLGARITSDLELVESLWSHFLGVFVAGLAMPMALLLFLFIIDWRLGLAVAAVFPAALAALWWTQKVLARPAAEVLQANADANAELHDYAQGITVIRSFGRFGQAWRRLQDTLDVQHRATVRVETRPAPWMAAFGFVLETGFVLLVMVGMLLLTGARLEPATLVVFIVLALPVYRQLYEVGVSTLLLRFGQRALARIEALLEEPTLPEPIQPRTPQGHAIAFEGVSFRYDQEGPQTLQDVSCALPERGLTAVVGPSGAGKSSFVHLIARLWDIQAGRITLGGVDLRDLGSDVLNDQVAMVFQDVVLFSGTVADNLRIARPDATDAQLEDAARGAGTHDFIMALPDGYATLLQEGGSSLSGGERQRLSIARALLKDAPILLLDEATASVDPSAEAELKRAIAHVARGRTVVVIAHRLRSVRDADLILVMDAGRVIERGSHASLLAEGGLYASLWQRQEQASGWSLARC